MPGHWRSHPQLADSDGPILYRTRFELAAPAAGTRRWITFDGIFYQADVWLDGAYLGDPEGYFFPHSFDVTALCRLGDEHVLAVEVTCNPERGTRGRRNITGLFQHSEAVDRDWNPGGLWRPVLVVRHRAGQARPAARAVPRRRRDPRPPPPVGPPRQRRRPHRARAHDRRRRASSARPSTRWPPAPTRSSGRSTSTDPRLWWPRALGDQPLTDIDVELLVDGEVSDRRSRRTGLREVAWNDWVLLDQRRAAVPQGRQHRCRPGPGSPTPHRTTSAATSSWRVEAGLDALRVQAHIADHELYRAADELGVLLLQDFPLQWGYARQIRREAVRQAREAVNALGHHPSIVQWCAHDEPVADAPQVDGGRAGRRLRRFVAQQLPTWNKTVLDRWLKRAFEQADPTRPTVAHGGVMPHLPQLDGTDTPPLARLAPRRGRRARRAGPPRAPARAVRQRVRRPVGARVGRPSSSTPSRWPELDWEALREHHGLEVEVMLRRGCRPPSTRRSTRGGRRPSATRRSCCATTSRRCAG